jgi:hypothetical protein
MKEQLHETQVLACDRNCFYMCRLHPSLFSGAAAAVPFGKKTYYDTACTRCA